MLSIRTACVSSRSSRQARDVLILWLNDAHDWQARDILIGWFSCGSRQMSSDDSFHGGCNGVEVAV